jgi:AcrR family transcriptional regulator
MTHHGDGKDLILETSAKLFGEKGYAGVSIRDIAQACGLTNAALYYHFKNKDDLFLAMLQRDHERVMNSLAEAVNRSGDLRDDLRRLIASYLKVTCEQRQSFQTLRRDLKQIEDPRARKLFGAMHADLLCPFESRLAAAQAAGELRTDDVKLFARLLYSMTIALSHAGPPGRVPGSDIEMAVDVFLNGATKQS